MIWKLYRGSEVIYVQATREEMRRRMYAYIREQRAVGVSLADVTFCYVPIRVHRWNAPTKAKGEVKR
jgi:hypothetical protein